METNKLIEQFTLMLVENTERLIEVLGAIILLLFAYFLYRSFKEVSSPVTGTAGISGSDFKRLEDTLKAVVEKAQPGKVISIGAGGAPVVTSEAGDLLRDDELKQLRDSLASKEAQIVELRAKPVGASGGTDTAQAKVFEDKIANLEARLAEYGIIEDDIADLANYKEENSKLKAEIEALRGGSSPAPSLGITPLDPPKPVPAPAAVAPAPLPEPVKPPVMTNEPDDLVAEFEAAVGADEAKGAPPVQVATTVAPPPPKPAPAPAAAAVPPPKLKLAENKQPSVSQAAAEQFITDDVLAEFSAAVHEDMEKSQVVNEAAPVKSDKKVSRDQESFVAAVEEDAGEVDEIDTDKMLAEVASFDPAELDISGTGLEEEADVDKMALEATKLAKG